MWEIDYLVKDRADPRERLVQGTSEEDSLATVLALTFRRLLGLELEVTIPPNAGKARAFVLIAELRYDPVKTPASASSPQGPS